MFDVSYHQWNIIILYPNFTGSALHYFLIRLDKSFTYSHARWIGSLLVLLTDFETTCTPNTFSFNVKPICNKVWWAKGSRHVILHTLSKTLLKVIQLFVYFFNLIQSYSLTSCNFINLNLLLYMYGAIRSTNMTTTKTWPINEIVVISFAVLKNYYIDLKKLLNVIYEILYI